MKSIIILFLIQLFFLGAVFSQQITPVGFSIEEKLNAQSINTIGSGIKLPPNYPNLRAMAEWEELSALTITWTTFTSILREIVRAAVSETNVIIVCSDSVPVKSYLTLGGVPLTNVRYLLAPYNTIWMRDYGTNPVYGNYVGDQILVDWHYNRPRPSDDTIACRIGSFLGIPHYETTLAPYDLIHTGGNYMSDGFGTAFSSMLTDQENPTLTASQIDTIMKKFMGINRYIRFPTCPYDGIHHIDMHMKLLDEETLLVGQYPLGISDGPQIEANLSYITSNFSSVFGTPYKVIRIPQMKDKNGLYPSQGGDYVTYTNAVFVNKTIILPIYYTQYDTSALRIWKEALPGYKIIGIDCDNSGANIIAQSGAIHCITHSIGAANPLLISAHALQNTCDTTNQYTLLATIAHIAGIDSSKIWWTTDTALGFLNSSVMSFVSANNWTGSIPAQQAGKTIFYYIQAWSGAGTTQVRPITAPQGWWKFSIGCSSLSIKENKNFQFKNIYPNPASAITCVPFFNEKVQHITVLLQNMMGETIETLYHGLIPQGEKNIFLHANKYEPGMYFVVIRADYGSYSQKILITK